MHYRSIADLNDAILRNLPRLPRDVDVVVGVPRSGLLAGTMAALAMNLPVADLDGFLAGRILATGRTKRRAQFDGGVDDMRNVLVVDDSADTGISMQEARKRLGEAYPDKTFTYCVVYGIADRMPGIDLILETVPQLRLFQWNLMHHDLLQHCCVDIDGVLCTDPTEAENDDGDGYLRFLAGTSPLHMPTKPIGYLVTSRLEKYRAQTEAWLKAHDVRYGQLIMLDVASKAERQRLNAHGRFKGETFRRLDALLFIESEAPQAAEIARISGKPVLCADTQQLIMPGPLSPTAAAQQLRTLPLRLRVGERNRLTAVKQALRHALGESLYTQLKKRVVGT